MKCSILCGDALEKLKTLESESVQSCITSPPYWGLRNYQHARQIGQEQTPLEYVSTIVAVMREVKRVLKKDGTLWINLGDCYAGSGKGGNPPQSEHQKQKTNRGSEEFVRSKRSGKRWGGGNNPCGNGLKPKDLVGIPWRVAFALQDDGWYLRSDIIWAKPNPMPEPVRDRPTRSHEYVFLLSKSRNYFYNADAIREPVSPALIKQVEEGYNGHAIKDYLKMNVQDASATKSRIINGARKRIDKQRGHGRRRAGFNEKWDALTPLEQSALGKNKRDVWTIATANFKEAHFATFPPKLIMPMILAGSKFGDMILDPFAGSGTTGKVAIDLGRSVILIEINPDYCRMIQDSCQSVQPPLLAL